MSKLYFEMSEAEQIFSRIEHDLEWATCMMAEGINTASSPMRMRHAQYRGLYGEACDLLNASLDHISRLRTAVEERYDEHAQGMDDEDSESEDCVEENAGVSIYEIDRLDAASVLRNMVLYDLHGAFDESGEEVGMAYIFRTNEQEEFSKYRTLIVYGDGTLKLSEAY